MSVEALPPREGVRVVAVTGEVDVMSAGRLLDLLAADGRPMVLDLRDVTFFDSAGVRLVDRVARDHSSAGCGLRLLAPPGGRARRVLDLVGFSGDLVVGDLDDALEQLRR